MTCIVLHCTNMFYISYYQVSNSQIFLSSCSKWQPWRSQTGFTTAIKPEVQWFLNVKKNIANIRDVETSLIFELTLIIIKHIILSFENRPRCVGSAGSLLFGIWAICSTLIFMCFTCNLNAILFTPSYESRVDTACQVLEHQLVKDSTKNTC